MNNYKNCPNCENIGFSVYPDPVTGEPEQEQCQFCYEEPNSVFNVITKLEADNQALCNELEALKGNQNKIKADAVNGLISNKLANITIEGIEWPIIYVEDAQTYANKLEAGK